MKWFATHVDEPLAWVALGLTALLPLVVVLAGVGARWARQQERDDISEVLVALMLIGFLGTLAWWFVVAPWNGVVFPAAMSRERDLARNCALTSVESELSIGKRC